MHISNHIHEWWRVHCLIKAQIPNEFFLDRLIKSLKRQIAKDVSLSGITNEEKTIIEAQQLDLVYSQSRNLYEIIPPTSRENYDPYKQNLVPHGDGVIVMGNQGASS